MKRYRSFIESFLKKGYRVIFFEDNIPKNNGLLLRHDVDFDINLAFKMSLVEDDLGVKSSYFFLLTSDFYNILAPKNIIKIKLMISNGHKVGLHFDPSLYDDVEEGFNYEKSFFESLFDTKVTFISIHRPAKYFLGSNDLIGGVGHSYQEKYFSQIKYFADSGGSFRYGSPIKSVEFDNNDSIQLVIHPVWWESEETDPIVILSKFETRKSNKFKEGIADNCIPYRSYLNSNKIFK